ncbi:sulfite exporter TauE/SafE family protein [Ideonella sp. DXS29W]|uniref:Probable membrane transporter protein n=2 Tax=Ideonella lacteola TaxID=2984193 RepID=A0ABU9BUK2_9BURK
MAMALGAVVGATLALTGAGGGILAVPLLVFSLHLGLAESAPIGLLAVGLAAGLGAALGLREGRVRYRAAMVIGGAGMLLAPLGVWLAQRVPNGPLTLVFSLVLAWSAWGMFQRARTTGGRAAVRAEAPPCVRNPCTGRFIWTRPCAMALASTGMASGMLSGLLGVGGGFVIVPALTRYSDLAADSIVSTSLAVIALVSISGVASATLHGSMPWGIAAPFAVGAMAALLAGRRLAGRFSGPTLQKTFAALSAMVALMLLVRGVAALMV